MKKVILKIMEKMILNNLPLKKSEAEFVEEDYAIEIKGENTYIMYLF